MPIIFVWKHIFNSDFYVVRIMQILTWKLNLHPYTWCSSFVPKSCGIWYTLISCLVRTTFRSIHTIYVNSNVSTRNDFNHFPFNNLQRILCEYKWTKENPIRHIWIRSVWRNNVKNLHCFFLYSTGKKDQRNKSQKYKYIFCTRKKIWVLQKVRKSSSLNVTF